MKLLISVGLALALLILEAFQQVATYFGQPENKITVQRNALKPVYRPFPSAGFSLDQGERHAGRQGTSAAIGQEAPIRLPVRIISAGVPEVSAYPFTPIQFCLSRQAEVTLQMFDAAGKPYGPNVRLALAAGWHQLELDASRLPPGIYIYRLQTRETTFTRKLLVLK
ncbi:MAG: T9SS type A sorting domain-containing protein [Calditrichaeota bacterium]|nr:T9SS type A sorting domain-containing protein [Calditrichota bacterium]